MNNDPIQGIDEKSEFIQELRRERDEARKYAALCRVQFEKASMAADRFQKEIMELQKKVDILTAGLLAQIEKDEAI